MKLAKSINISSNSTIPFAAALTNPTELAKAKGHLKNSYPVSFRDNPFRPANTTHKAEKYYQDKPALILLAKVIRKDSNVIYSEIISTKTL